MAEPGETGSTALMYHCPNCGMDFPVEDGQDTQACPVCEHVCDKETCLTHQASKEDY